jgi:cytochrome c oxidase assembly protein subunit 11
VSTYNVVPDKAGAYFNKIQCFCFEQQRLRGGEEVDMPVFFYIDPEMAADFNLRNVNDITLSYCFFRVEDEEAEAAEAAEAAASAPPPAPGSGIRLHGAGALPPGIAPPAPAPQ